MYRPEPDRRLDDGSRRSDGTVRQQQAQTLFLLTFRDHDQLITCFIYLDDADASNGCLQVIPGSHIGKPCLPFKPGSRFEIDPAFIETSKAVPVPLCAGEELAWRLESFGWTVATGYGLTETAPMLSALPPGDRNFASAGRAVPGVFAYVPASLSVADDRLILHANLGWHFERDEHEHAKYRKSFSEEGHFRDLPHWVRKRQSPLPHRASRLTGLRRSVRCKSRSSGSQRGSASARPPGRQECRAHPAP
jgi:hypothetical protein